MEKYQEIIETIERMKHSQVISKHLLFTDAITGEKLSEHAKYVALEPDEKPLVLVDVKKAFCGRMTGLLVTDRNVYYRCLRIKTFFRALTMFYSSKITGKVALCDVNQISLGDWIMGSGTDTSYLGHRLSINGAEVGTLLLGKYYSFDDKLVENLKQLFKALE